MVSNMVSGFIGMKMVRYSQSEVTKMVIKKLDIGTLEIQKNK